MKLIRDLFLLILLATVVLVLFHYCPFFRPQETYYSVGIIAAIGALITYHRNSALEKVKWATALHREFFASDSPYRKMRALLDCAADTIKKESLQEKDEQEDIEEDLVDYLNFFEQICYLRQKGFLEADDVKSGFSYYLDCLKRHEAVRNYIATKGNSFENLSRQLSRTN